MLLLNQQLEQVNSLEDAASFINCIIFFSFLKVSARSTLCPTNIHEYVHVLSYQTFCNTFRLN